MRALMIIAGIMVPLLVSLIAAAEWGKVLRSAFIAALLSLIFLAILIFIDRDDEGGLFLIATIVGLPTIFGLSIIGAVIGSLMYKPTA